MFSIFSRARRGGATAGRQAPALLMVPAPENQPARVGLWLSAGSAHEHRSGVAHLLEHVVCDQHFRRALPGGIAGRPDALTSWFWTAYLWTGNADELVPAIEHCLKIFAFDTLDAGLVEHHRRIIAMELAERGSEGIVAGLAALRSKAFKGSGFDRDPAGTVEEIDALRIDDLESFRARFYDPQRTCLIVTAPQAQLQRARRRWPQHIVSEPDDPAAAPIETAMPPPDAEAQIETAADAPIVVETLEDGARRHLLFACRGRRSNNLTIGRALAAARLFEQWLAREAPGSLLSELTISGARHDDVRVQCHLTPEGQPLLIGSVSLRQNADVEALSAGTRRVLANLPDAQVAQHVFGKLVTRERNARSRQPEWSLEAMMRLGALFSTYGAGATLGLKQNLDTLELAELQALLAGFGALGGAEQKLEAVNEGNPA